MRTHPLTSPVIVIIIAKIMSTRSLGFCQQQHTFHTTQSMKVQRIADTVGFLGDGVHSAAFSPRHGLRLLHKKLLLLRDLPPLTRLRPRAVQRRQCNFTHARTLANADDDSPSSSWARVCDETDKVVKN